MKLPDLTVAADAGVREWSGAPDAIKAAASAAHLKVYTVDLHGVDSKSALMAALGKATKECQHCGNNFDARADTLEDDDWLGKNGVVIVLRHSGPFRKAHPADWETLTDILGEGAEYWQERHKPFWVFVG